MVTLSFFGNGVHLKEIYNFKKMFEQAGSRNCSLILSLHYEFVARKDEDFPLINFDLRKLIKINILFKRA